MHDPEQVEERNSDETRDRLNELFDGDYGWQCKLSEK